MRNIIDHSFARKLLYAIGLWCGIVVTHCVGSMKLL